MSIARTAIPLIAALIALASSPALAAKAATPFCLPGEVRVCTLGPPPVCSCKPKASGVRTDAVNKSSKAFR
jgi:hypothetical protein